MRDPFFRPRALLTVFVWCLLSALSLTGCGGGGGADGNGNKAMGSPTSSTGTTSSGLGGSSGSSSTTAATVQGVAAVGSALIGATVTIVDAAGVVQASTTTAMADGQYAVTLGSTSPTLPLLIQAKGVDMQGSPVVLYSLLQSLSTGTSARTTANISPLTTAVVATMLGAEPSATFQAAAVSHTALPTLLGNATAYANANTFIKTAVRANLSDAKLTNIATVDLFNDATFVANKLGLDAAIEGVRVQFGIDSGGNEVLYLSNKLIAAGTTEVAVNLTTTQHDLGTFPQTISAAATTSSLTATTSTSTVMPFVSGLEAVKSALNGAMSTPNVSASTISALQVSSKNIFSTFFTYQDSYDINGAAGLLSTAGGSGRQLSSFQIIGCLDDPSTFVSGRCSNILVSALLLNAASTPSAAAAYPMVASYSSSTGWTFIGNNHQTPWNLYPVTWVQLDATGAVNTTAQPTPGIGLMAAIVSSGSLSVASLQLPSGQSYHFSDCAYPSGTNYMCQGSAVLFSGDFVADHVMAITGTSFIGRSDVLPGNKFTISTQTLGAGSENNSEYLTTGLPSDRTTVASGSSTLASTSPYPVPDGLSSSTYLQEATVDAGFTLTWSTWAAAHPDMHMVEVRTSVTSPTAPVVNQVPISPIQPNSATVPALASVPSDAINRILWLIAQDNEGHRYITKIVAAP
jgi:hypothetical protein